MERRSLIFGSIVISTGAVPPVRERGEVIQRLPSSSTDSLAEILMPIYTLNDQYAMIGDNRVAVFQFPHPQDSIIYLFQITEQLEIDKLIGFIISYQDVGESLK